jgi:hypothetical protein
MFTLAFGQSLIIPLLSGVEEGAEGCKIPGSGYITQVCY